jgi:hypothetical protein
VFWLVFGQFDVVKAKRTIGNIISINWLDWREPPKQQDDPVWEEGGYLEIVFRLDDNREVKAKLPGELMTS